MTGSTRTIWIMALTAVISLGAGIGLSKLIISPADAAAQAAPPEAGAITVPVEQRALANDVVLRGDAIYEDPASVTLETGDIGGPAVVTGQVPEVGATLDAGGVMLEVAGRPVILLSGELPVYRTMRAGVTGPDVLQLKAALGALGIGSGDPASPAYDAATAAGVRELYAKVGYPAPSAGEEADMTLESAKDAVTAAEQGVTTAQNAVNTAATGTPQAERVALQAAVNTAQVRLDVLRTQCAADLGACAVEITEAEGELNGAIAARDAADAAPDTTEARATLAAAQRTLTDARADLTKAQADTITPLPASEVVFLSSTPRRVDTVDVRRGSTVSGTAVMKVSGAALQIAGTVPAADAELISVGAVVTITLPDDQEVPGKVQSIGAPPADGATNEESSTRKRVVVVPDALTEEQRAVLQGANVRMRIPVSSTEGEVLAVPTAALTAGPGGEARVEVMGDGEDTTLVTVETGLAAGGFVEVTPVDGTLKVGDRVVVGQDTSAADKEGGDEPTDEESSDEESTEG
ncbi:hypothetical protein [Actinotalea subterranea]|uniref:hypothetical protein n=1 Tax=Actinotalea subterranea TaxID=2607497 RepID=UPI001FEAA10D|nr:hypothetical protein [Actinotalea subterranea]